MSASSDHPPILCYLETHVRVPLSGGYLIQWSCCQPSSCTCDIESLLRNGTDATSYCDQRKGLLLVCVHLVSLGPMLFKMLYVCQNKINFEGRIFVRDSVVLPLCKVCDSRAFSGTGHNLFAYIRPTTVQGRILYGPQPFCLHMPHYCSGPYLVRATTFLPTYAPLLFGAVSVTASDIFKQIVRRTGQPTTSLPWTNPPLQPTTPSSKG